MRKKKPKPEPRCKIIKPFTTNGFHYAPNSDYMPYLTLPRMLRDEWVARGWIEVMGPESFEKKTKAAAKTKPRRKPTRKAATAKA